MDSYRIKCQHCKKITHALPGSVSQKVDEMGDAIDELKAKNRALETVLSGAIRVIDFAKHNSHPVDAEFYFEASRVAKLALGEKESDSE